jgi:NAD(P)-dependent dehydrogenase (short-subunit alcohol dehydrogenase family)
MVSEIFNLTGKVALVTGGSKGLGKAMARGLAEAGADIIISSRHEDELRSALDEVLKGTGRKGRLIVADMSKRAEADRLARTALEQMGRVDILVNNAGTNVPQPIDAIKDADWDRVLELNLSSVMALTRALVPQMKARKWGRIVHISSIMGFISKAGRGAYSATKSALLGLTRGAGRARRHRELHLSRPLPDGSSGGTALRPRKTGDGEDDRPRSLGRPQRAGRPDSSTCQRRGQLYHGRSARRGWRLPGAVRR